MRFYSDETTVCADLRLGQGVIIPRGEKYWFEAYEMPFPKRVITDTGKTQYLFRINKGVENLGESINHHMPEEQRPIPFSNMIYFGDGDTDVPSMAVMRKNGGYAVAVHPPGKSKQKGMDLFKAGRCDFFAVAGADAGRRDGQRAAVEEGEVAADAAGDPVDVVGERGERNIADRVRGQLRLQEDGVHHRLVVHAAVLDVEGRGVEYDVAALQAREVDFINVIHPDYLDQLKANPQLAISMIPVPNVWGFQFNSAKAPFNDVRVRRAMNLAVDREAFSALVTARLRSHPLMQVEEGEVELLPPPPELAVLATGPLTAASLPDGSSFHAAVTGAAIGNEPRPSLPLSACALPSFCHKVLELPAKV